MNQDMDELLRRLTRMLSLALAMKDGKQEDQMSPSAEERNVYVPRLMQFIRQRVNDYGGEREKKALERFEADPEDYEGALKNALRRLCTDNYDFFIQLQLTFLEGRATESVEQDTHRNTNHVNLRGIQINVDDEATVGTLIGENNVINYVSSALDEKKNLNSYLQGLTSKLRFIPLRGIDQLLEDTTAAPTLSQAYVILATEKEVQVEEGRLKDLKHYFDLKTRSLKKEHNPDFALPSSALSVYIAEGDQWVSCQPPFPSLPLTKLLRLTRPLLASEVVKDSQYLMLLGNPGSGKSTFLRYLVWALSQSQIKRNERLNEILLSGWMDKDSVEKGIVPILISMRKVARLIAEKGMNNTTIYDALLNEMREYCSEQMDYLLSTILDKGIAVLLFDGLDEVPVEALPNSASRLDTLRAVRDFGSGYEGVKIVITCRVRAFNQEIRNAITWRVETLAPFSLGQIRHFLSAWFEHHASKGQLDREQATRMAPELMDTITKSLKLRNMACNPLLLTMMALIFHHREELPRDRPMLYERILDLLLGQWDKIRQGKSLPEAIGNPDWESTRMLPVIDLLSYNAHRDASSEDGIGSLSAKSIREELIQFFTNAQFRKPGHAAEEFLHYIDERSGILLPHENNSYTFAHLTLQEHCAGRHLVLSGDAVSMVMKHRTDDRWTEPILLGIGVSLTQPAVANSIFMELLASVEQDDQPKSALQWFKDLLLLFEIGNDRGWDYLRTLSAIQVGRIQERLRRALIKVLDDISLEHRIHALRVLAEIGDPRIPVTLEEWINTLRNINLKNQQEISDSPLSMYWRHIPPQTYKIDQENSISVPSFWISRYLVTKAQFEQFLIAGAYDEQTDWTPIGKEWKRSVRRKRPLELYGNLGSNHPIVGTSWYEASAWAAWITRLLREQDQLPVGMEIRLPTDIEWELSCYTGDSVCPLYPWGNEHPNPDRAIYQASNLDRPAPVGSCPAGSTWSGVFDMGGNIWEWTTTRSIGYAIGNEVWRDFRGTDPILLRGGSFIDRADALRTRSKYTHMPEGDFYRGFRIVLVSSQ